MILCSNQKSLTEQPMCENVISGNKKSINVCTNIYVKKMVFFGRVFLALEWTYPF